MIAGRPLLIGFTAQDGTLMGATVNGEQKPIKADPLRGQTSAKGMDAIVDAPFTPSQPGSYTVTATALPAFGTPANASATFRAIAVGGTTMTSVPGRFGPEEVGGRDAAGGGARRPRRSRLPGGELYQGGVGSISRRTCASTI